MKMQTLLSRLPLWLTAALLAGCATAPTTQMAPNPAHVQSTKEPRKLFVFLDGTSNDWRARTNVRRLFELVAAQEDPTRLCLWVEGVGTKGVLGKGLGLGMKPRIMAGYGFLARNYRKGDEIYVFGFSRGALEARALCGMLAHCGLCRPQGAGEVPLDRIWDECRRLEEESISGLENRAEIGRVFERRLKTNRAQVRGDFPGRVFADVRVKFLGLWDTVPGLQFTKFNSSGEQVKDGRVNPQPRYKVKPYPNIDRIAQALSMDEVRSKFEPLLVGPPLVADKPEVFEVWFPGAHSDIGGGYSDSNEMAGVSLDWMLRLLGEDALIPGAYRVSADARGILHHPELDFWGSFASQRQQRLLPKNAIVHESFLNRVEATAPLRECLDPAAGKYVHLLYRPDPGVQTGDGRSATNAAHPFLTKPRRPDGTPDPDRSKWVFHEREFRAAFKIATTDAAESKPVTGRPLAPEVAQVKVAPVAAVVMPKPVIVAPSPAPTTASMASRMVKAVATKLLPAP